MLCTCLWDIHLTLPWSGHFFRNSAKRTSGASRVCWFLKFGSLLNIGQVINVSPGLNSAQTDFSSEKKQLLTVLSQQHVSIMSLLVLEIWKLLNIGQVINVSPGLDSAQTDFSTEKKAVVNSLSQQHLIKK